MFCPVRCLIVVFSGSCLALSSLVGEDGASYYYFFFFLSMACVVCRGLFPLPPDVIGYVLLLCPLLYNCTILFVLICDSSNSHFMIQIIL